MRNYPRVFRNVALALVVVLLSDAAIASSGGDHLVTAGDVNQALSNAAAARENDRQLVQRFLETPLAQEAASRLRIQPARLQAAVATLSDHELNDLAQRTAALRVDPTAGQAYFADFGTAMLLYALLLVLIVAAAVGTIVAVT